MKACPADSGQEQKINHTVEFHQQWAVHHQPRVIDTHNSNDDSSIPKIHYPSMKEAVTREVNMTGWSSTTSKGASQTRPKIRIEMT